MAPATSFGTTSTMQIKPSKTRINIAMRKNAMAMFATLSCRQMVAGLSLGIKNTAMAPTTKGALIKKAYEIISKNPDTNFQSKVMRKLSP